MHSTKFSMVLVAAMVLFAGCSSKYLADISPIPTIDYKGNVINYINDQPVEGAVVYLNGTEYRDESAADGSFSFQGVKEGTYDLIILAPSFFNHLERVSIYNSTTTQGNTTEFAIHSSYANFAELPSDPDMAITALKSQVEQLQRKVSRNDFTFNQEWIENLQLFQRHFLGSERTSDISILNPQSIQFFRDTTNRDHILSASSDDPLLIVNNRLGYRVEMVLDTLLIRNSPLGIDLHHQATTNFTEIETSNIESIERWEKNRQHVFRGSLRHFLMTLPTGRIHSEGFEMFSGARTQGPQSMGSTESSIQDVGVFADRILVETENPNEFYLSPPEELTITFRHIDPQSKPQFAMSDWNMKRSFLQFDEGDLRFNSNGLMLNPETLRVSGYWKYEQVMEMLPHYYNPHIDHPALQ